MPEPRPLLFVESNTTGTGMIALHTAARLGVRPVLLTSRPSRYAGLTGPSAPPCDVVECDTNDPAALRAAVGSQLAGRSPAGIMTTSEYYLAAVAALAEEFGVRGNRPIALANCRNKARTRQVLSAAGMAQPRFRVLTGASGLAAAVPAAVEHVGLPCVVKPVDDSGSTNVVLCSTAEQVASHAAAVLAVTENTRGQPVARAVLVEEYLPQPELSVEVFSVAGAATCVGITEKVVTGAPYFVETQHIFPAPLPAAAAAEIAETARLALKSTGIEHGASHIELKLTAGGPAVVEINARLAGGMIPELVRLATGIELLEQQLRAAIGLPVDLAPSLARSAGIRFLLAPRDGVLRAVHGVAEASRLPGVERVEVIAAAGARVQPARSFADRLGYVIAVGDSYDDVAAALRSAAEALTVEVDTDGG